MQNHDSLGLRCSETHRKIRCTPRTSYNLFEVTTSQGDERDDVIYLTNLWLASTNLAVLIQGCFFFNPFAYFQFYFYYSKTLKKNSICCHFNFFLILLNFNVSRLQNLLDLAKAVIVWIISSYAYTYICLPLTATSYDAEWDFHMRKDFKIKPSQNTSENVTVVPLKSIWI